MDRRRFLHEAAFFTVAAVLPASAAELAPLPTRAGRPLRVRGRVHVAGKGLAGVAVSDGLSVVATREDGTYELISSSGRPFVFVSVPAGHRIPVHATGTARFYAPLAAQGDEAAASFELQRLERPDTRHAVLVLGDIQTEDADEMGWFHEQTIPDLLATRRSLGDVETFSLAVGDIMFDRLQLYPEYERAVARLGVPSFQVVGNHDLDMDAGVDEGATRTFERHFGPRYYSFDRGEVHYVVLDDVFWYGAGYLGYLDLDQLTWLANDLARVERGRTVVVALHIPTLGSYYRRDGRKSPDGGRSVMNRDALYRLLEPYRAHILAGHMHESEHLFEGGRHEHVVGAVCGAWWSGPICGDGTPSGYAVYEVNGSDVRWRAKATGLPGAHQMRVYARGTDPAAPDAVLANVWDWDPEWKLTWYEDGERRGELRRREAARDPLSVELHAGPDKPARRRWVDPYPIDHLFEARPSAGARAIRIEAVDRFGRTYTADVPTTGAS